MNNALGVQQSVAGKLGTTTTQYVESMAENTRGLLEASITFNASAESIDAAVIAYQDAQRMLTETRMGDLQTEYSWIAAGTKEYEKQMELMELREQYGAGAETIYEQQLQNRARQQQSLADERLSSLQDEYEWISKGTAEYEKQMELAQLREQYGAGAEAVYDQQQRNSVFQGFAGNYSPETSGMLMEAYNTMTSGMSQGSEEALRIADYLANGRDYAADIQTQIDEAAARLRAGDASAAGDYAAGKVAEAGMNLAQGTDTGDFMQGMAQGGPIMGVINMLIGAFTRVLGGLEGMDKVLSPVTEILQGFAPTLQMVVNVVGNVMSQVVELLQPVFDLVNSIVVPIMAALQAVMQPIIGVLKDLFDGLKPIFDIVGTIVTAVSPIIALVGQLMIVLSPSMIALKAVAGLLQLLSPVLKIVGDAFKVVSGAIANFVKFITFGASDLSDSMDALQSSTDDEAERMKALNDQYSRLKDAIEEQEAYYLEQRRSLNADYLNETVASRNVNDAIITPQGVVNTSPQDYIIATKHPENLTGAGGGGVQLSVQIINNAGAEVSTQQSDDGELLVLIEKRIESNIASGRYDGALSAQQARQQGRKVMS